MKFIHLAAKYFPAVMPVASGGSGGATSMSNILSMATELWTWLLTQMAAILGFITNNSLILSMFIITISGLAVGMLFRIWHSVR